MFLLATHSYMWWLGANAWYPDNKVKIWHDGALIKAKVYRANFGTAIIWESDKERFGLTVTDGSPPQLFYGIEFRDYGFFALPVGGIGVQAAPDNAKNEHDPKFEWTYEGWKFKDMNGHDILISYRP